jgi:hypothetical protein
MDYSVSLGITPKNYSPEEILNLPEQIAAKMDIHIVVCIDEFQQSISELLAQCSPLFIQQSRINISPCCQKSVITSSSFAVSFLIIK